MKAFKKIASIVIASSMLASVAPMAVMAEDASALQTAIKAEVGDAYVVDGATGSIDIVLDADTDVKKDSATNYGDKYISVSKSKSKAKSEGASLTGDFKSTLDMDPVRKTFEAYKAAAEKYVASNGDGLLQATLPTIPVTGNFQISVVYNKDMITANEAYHLEKGSMNGFNDTAKLVFVDTDRKIVDGAVIAGTGVAVEGTTDKYKTLLIDVVVKAPEGGLNPESLVYGDLAANYESYLADIEYTVDDVTVTSASYDEDVYFTESIEMAGSIKIGAQISTINFTTKQLADNEDTYANVEGNDLQDWEKISATMALKVTTTGTGDGGGGGSFSGGITTPAPVPQVTATPDPNAPTADPNATPDPNATMDPQTPSSTIPPYSPHDNKVPSVLNGDDHFVYIIGYPEGDVRPEGNITREEVATIFYRILKDEFRDTIYTKNHNYSDVELSRWSNKAIATLTNGGFIQGYGDDANTFKPAGDMTRLEFIVMATNFLDESDSDVKYLDDVKFTDVPERLSWGQEALQKAAIAELIDEDERTAFRPEEKIKRHEAMKIINRLLVRNVKEGGLMEGFVVWPDNPSDAPYYYEVIEATNSHTFERLEDGYEKWTSVDQNWIWGEFKTQYEDPDEIDKQ